MRRRKQSQTIGRSSPPADLDHAKASVLNSLSSPQSRRNYRFAMDQFIAGTARATPRAQSYRCAQISTLFGEPRIGIRKLSTRGSLLCDALPMKRQIPVC